MGDFPAAGLFLMLGFMAEKSAGYPLGGSLAFARAIEAGYLSLGGKIRYGSKVDGIIVEEGKAVGLRGSWGEARGDYGDLGRRRAGLPRTPAGWTLCTPRARRPLCPLPSNPTGKARRGKADATLRPYPSLIYIGLGLDRDWSSVPHMQTFTLPKPLLLESGGLAIERIGICIFSFDPAMAPAGKTAATVMLETYNDGYWTDLRERDRPAYEEEKRKTARKVIAALEVFLPGLATSVETIDVATPYSFIAFTSNRHGSYEGWLPTGAWFGRKLSKTLPGLGNFYMVGQWLNPGGGLPPCGIEGRNLAKRICAVEGLSFRPD